MALKALITLDLDKVSAKQRIDFYDYLENENLEKISNIDTAWKCSFTDGTSRMAAISICKTIIEQAIKKASISSSSTVSSVIQVGDGDVIEF